MSSSCPQIVQRRGRVGGYSNQFAAVRCLEVIAVLAVFKVRSKAISHIFWCRWCKLINHIIKAFSFSTPRKSVCNRNPQKWDNG